MGNYTAPNGSSDSQMSGVALALKALRSPLRLRKARLTERERIIFMVGQVEAETND